MFLYLCASSLKRVHNNQGTEQTANVYHITTCTVVISDFKHTSNIEDRVCEKRLSPSLVRESGGFAPPEDFLKHDVQIGRFWCT